MSNTPASGNAINSGLKNGEDLLSAQNYTEALVAFDGVLKLDWNNAAAIFGKAKAYAGAGNYKMANTFFEEALLKEKNKEKAIKALMIHPLINTYNIAEKITDEFLELYKEYIGEWK